MKKWGIGLTILGVLLLGVALFLAARSQMEASQAGKASQEALTSLNQLLSTPVNTEAPSTDAAFTEGVPTKAASTIVASTEAASTEVASTIVASTETASTEVASTEMTSTGTATPLPVAVTAEPVLASTNTAESTATGTATTQPTAWISTAQFGESASPAQTTAGTNPTSETATTLPERTSPEPTNTPAATREPEFDPTQPMPVRTVNGEDYVAVLTIPALRLELPVMASWSYDRLKTAPCAFQGSMYYNPYRRAGDTPRSFVIIGHNYEAHFGRLQTLAGTAAHIYLRDMDNNLFVYVVTGMETLKPTQLEDIVFTEDDLTLLTCTPGGITRDVLRCTLEAAYTADEAQPAMVE